MPKNILVIESSPLGERSLTRQLTVKVLHQLKTAHPDAKVAGRDLAVAPLPHLDGMTIGAFFTPPAQRNAALAEAAKASDTAVAELLQADILVLGAPMWNFGIPSALKAWIDHVVRAGLTFKYGANGPEGLVQGKRAIVVSARGGIYSQGPMQSYDHQERYLKDVLGFIGITDVAFVRAEGVALGAEAAQAAMQQADSQLGAVVRQVA